MIRKFASVRVRVASSVLCVVVAGFVLLPLYWIVIAATKSQAEIVNSFGFWFARGMHLGSNLRMVFTYDGSIFTRWLENTALYASVSAIVVVVISVMGGYVFARVEFPAQRQLFWVVVGSVMVPATTVVIPLYLLLAAIHLTNNIWGFILPSLVSPLGVYLMRVYSEAAVPRELLDAARMDGANELQIIRRVVVRLVSPGAVTVLLIVFIATWNNYFLPLLIFDRQGLYPVTVGLAIWVSQASVSNAGSEVLYALVVTGGLVAMVPLIVLFVCLQRYWRPGLLMGGLTG